MFSGRVDFAVGHGQHCTSAVVGFITSARFDCYSVLVPDSVVIFLRLQGTDEGVDQVVGGSRAN